MGYTEMAMRFDEKRANAYSERDTERRRIEWEQGVAFLEEFDQICRDYNYTIKGGELVGYGKSLHDDVMFELTKQLEERAT
jgi:hypothetical protein